MNTVVELIYRRGGNTSINLMKGQISNCTGFQGLRGGSIITRYWESHVLRMHVHTLDVIVFAAFIHANITITFRFFLFRRNQSLLLAIIIIRTWSLCISIRFLIEHSHYVDSFLLIIFNCFIDVSNCFVDAKFKSSFNWISNLFD